MPQIPGTDIVTSSLGLGGNVFGWSADEAASFDVLDAFADAGGTMIDTADVYAAWLGTEGGESETIIGKWMAARGNRGKMIIATKVGSAPGYDNLQPGTIRGALERSLTRLQTDYVDVYYAHYDRPDPLVDTMATFDALVREGKVRSIAASNYSAARLEEALDISADHGWNPYSALQPEYSLLERTVYDTELAPLCVARGLGTFPYYGLARGYLTGKYRLGGPAVDSVRAQGTAQYVNDNGERVLAVLEQVADGHAVPMASVALAWLSTRPAVIAPLASARTVDQLSDLLPAMGLTLTSEEIHALNLVSSTT